MQAADSFEGAPSPLLIDRWAALERRFSASLYDGSADAAPYRYLTGHRADILFTAPHAVNHVRNDAPKVAEIGTGGLAELLAVELEVSALVAQAHSGDPNWDPETTSLFKQKLRSVLKPGILVVDLHGMRDSYGMDICVGRGDTPDARSQKACDLLVAFSEAAGLTSAIDRPFDARRQNTVTSFVQLCGGSALQIEIAKRLRIPNPENVHAQRLLAALLGAFRKNADSA